MNVSPWGAVPPMPSLFDVVDAFAFAVVVLLMVAFWWSRVNK